MAPTDTSRDPGKQFAGRPPGGCSGYAGAIALDRPPGVFPDFTHDPNAEPPEAPMEGAPDPENLADGTTYAEVVDGAIYYWEVTDGAYELTYIDTDCCKMPEVIDPSDVLAAASELVTKEVTELTPEIISQFILTEFPDAPAGQDFLIGGADPLVNPDYVFTANGDGSAHCVKAPPGEGLTTLPPILTKSNDEAGAANKLVDEVSNPVMRVDCSNGVVEVEDCNGDIHCFRSANRRACISVIASQVDNFDHTTVEGTALSDGSHCVNLDFGKCGSELDMRGYHSYTMEAVDNFEGSMSVGMQHSCDGGATWRTTPTGGADELRLNPSDENAGLTVGEQSFPEFDYQNVDAGPKTVCMRLFVRTNNATSGELNVVPRSAELNLHYNRMECCNP